MAGAPASSTQQTGIAPSVGAPSGLPMAAPQQPSTIGIGPPADMVRQPMQRPMMAPAQQVQNAGLQALMANMMAQYRNVPGGLAMTQRPQMMMPRYSAPAVAYRPNMQAVQQNLARVKPSVYKTDLDTARERIAELEAEQQQRQQAQNIGGDYSGG